ncbi:MAG: regulatory protein RecX [Fimbriimonadales bacterium]
MRAALGYLKTRARFADEIRRHLAGTGFEASDVEGVLRYLGERKLIDDERTALDMIERHSGKRAAGTQRLREELRNLGASEEAIEAGLAAIESDDPERALDALRAKYKSGADRGKAGRFLVSRGFGEDAVEAALDVFCGLAES